MPRLADRWRCDAHADFPGCGYSDTPNKFNYDFDGYSEFRRPVDARNWASDVLLSTYTISARRSGSAWPSSVLKESPG